MSFLEVVFISKTVFCFRSAAPQTVMKYVFLPVCSCPFFNLASITVLQEAWGALNLSELAGRAGGP